jgi:1-deoxy-D-xylulose-5-phosphate synthase
MSLLSRINGPEDLKKLKTSQLKLLAEEIRKLILEVVSKNGGHLAPNLGVVELTLALHYVFDTPKDKIIWDVGHQCYTHKIITGRREAFRTLRTFQGLAGFPKRAESPYDVLDTGHSSTSVSAGLGMSVARRLKGESDKIVVVIGDGSITAGMAFEALNNAGYLKEDLLIVLNDNEMSISPNVGALSSFVSKRMTGNLVRFIKKEMEKIVPKFPGGDNLLHLFKKGEDLLKMAVTPGALFTALNFEYVGPVDGHDLDTLIEILKNLKELKGPVIFHVITKKGKGYPPAEADPETFHGIGPFNLETGKPLKTKGAPPTYTEVFGDTLIKLAEREPKLIAITAAMKSGTGLKRFAQKFPDRFFDVGICEQHAVTFAAGLALEGFIPVCAIYSTFLQRAYDQIIHDVALNKAKVIFAIDRAGLVGEDGPTHHGAFDFSFLRAVPNIIICAPKDEKELRDLLFSAIQYEGPCAIRYPRGEAIGVEMDETFGYIPPGKGELLKDGKDGVIFSIGSMCYPSLEAGLELEKKGLSVAVINVRFLKPLDRDLLREYAQRTGRVLVVEENSIYGGLGSALAELILEEGLEVKFARLGLPDHFIEQGDLKTLREKYGLSTENIVEKFVNLVRRA